MNATKINSGAWIATETTAEERVRLRALGWWYHPANCTRGRCAACRAGVRPGTWYTFSDFNARDLALHTEPDLSKALNSKAQSIEMSRKASASIEIPAPEGLRYLPFQLAGMDYCLKHPRTILGDEMGLGKTIQALGIVNELGCKPVLIVCPARLRINWANEARKWLLGDWNLHIAETTDPVPGWFDLVITNYEKCIRPYHLESLAMRQWGIVIFDEAHYLKNPEAIRTQVGLKGSRLAIPQNLDEWVLLKPAEKRTDCEIRRLRPIAEASDRVMFLSGTPLDNDPLEIQTLAASCCPSEFDNRAAFERRYKAGCYDKNQVWDPKGPSNLPELQYRLRAHCMIRRLKKDVLKELPAKVRQVVPLPTNGAAQLLSEERSTWAQHQEDLYELAACAELARASGNEESYRQHVKGLAGKRMEAFAALGKVRHELARRKVPQVLEHCKEAIQHVGKILIFGHHRDVLEAIHEGIPGSVLFYGGMTMEATEQARKTFMEDPDCPAFCGSMMAAGLGLTLTATNTAIFAELSWVPKDLRQSEDRIHRIGQEQSVLIQHLVYEGSLDAIMANRLVEKMEMADKALDRRDEEQELLLGLEDAAHVHAAAETEELTTEEQKAATEALRRLPGADLHPVDLRIASALARAQKLNMAQMALALQLATKYLRGSGEAEVGRRYARRMAHSVDTAPIVPQAHSRDGGDDTDFENHSQDPF